ncbi:MAG: arginine decarboxylase, pyruvoyl-dependent [Parcubacteria group bacterium]|nr:arginine decarboxylase, pyruvoyl-dependent [Parcubacteria group bacterium]
MVPKRLFFTKGVGRHKDKLTSFELALREAGIEKCNLVTVSSIVAPGCQILSREEGMKYIHAGQITFVVMSRNETNEGHRLISSSVGVAIPQDRSIHGYISEHHAYGVTEKEAGDYAERLAVTMLATTLGSPIDSVEGLHSENHHYQIGNQVFDSSNVAAEAICERDGEWTTVITAVVLILE